MALKGVQGCRPLDELLLAVPLRGRKAEEEYHPHTPSGLLVKNEGDRPIIHQFHLHICPKLALSNG